MGRQQHFGATLLSFSMLSLLVFAGGHAEAVGGGAVPLGHAKGAMAHGLSQGKGGVNDGTESEAAELFDIFEDNNNVYGLVGSSDSVHYLGISLSLSPCHGVSLGVSLCV